MVRDKKIILPDSVSGISIMLGINDLNLGALKEVLNNLHSRYADTTIYVNSIYHVGENYTVVTNSQIDEMNNDKNDNNNQTEC